MPEVPEILSFKYDLDGLLAHYGPHVLAYLQIHPSSFAIGSKRRPWDTCTTESIDYDPASELKPADWVPNVWDSARARDQPYEYLLKPLVPGPFFHRVKGEHLAIGAGYHTATIHFALEAHPVIFTRAQYEELVTSASVPGTNKDPAKADLLRTFIIPESFINPNSVPKKNGTPRTITILLTVHFPDHVWALVDFSRLARFHIISHARPVDGAMFESLTQNWESLFRMYGDGPDWILQTDKAQKELVAWRHRVKAGLDPGMIPIVSEFHINNKVFAGIGRHLANDLCHHVPVHPLMPVILFCQDDDLFGLLQEELPVYMKFFADETKFLKCVAPRSSIPMPGDPNDAPEHNTPLVYTYSIQLKYRNLAVHVFRVSQCARVSKVRFIRMANRGLFDPDFVLGRGPYDADKAADTIQRAFARGETEKCNLAVYHYHGETNYPGFSARPISCYTAFAAQPHPEWYSGPRRRIAPDMASAKMMTTVGPGEFRNLKDNADAPEVIVAQRTGRRGRPPKAKSQGRVGRPAKVIVKKSEAEQSVTRLQELRDVKKILEDTLPEFAWLRAERLQALASTLQPISGVSSAHTLSSVAIVPPSSDDDDEEDPNGDDEDGNAAFERAYAIAELGHSGVQKLAQRNLYKWFGMTEPKWSESRSQHNWRTWRTMGSGGWRPPAATPAPAPLQPSPSPQLHSNPGHSASSAPVSTTAQKQKTQKPRYTPPQPDDDMYPISMNTAALFSIDLSKLFPREMKEKMMSAPRERPAGKRMGASIYDYDSLAAQVNQILWQHGVSSYIEYPDCGVESDRYG